MSQEPKIKRMAILNRRGGDDRSFFQNHWLKVHGGLVAGLPYLRSYVQNHVQEDFVEGGAPPAFKVDGLVEQVWNSDAEMQMGYRPDSDQVKAMLVDEPNYIGHGTNYAMLYSAPLYTAEDGSKLIVIVRHRGDTRIADDIFAHARAQAGCNRSIRDDVLAVIPKFNMKEPPVPVDAFLHLYFDGPENARRAGQDQAAYAQKYANLPNIALGVVRVRTATII